MKDHIGLDNTARKFKCPGCDKNRFVRYYNFTLKEYFPDQYGRCDREIKCGYFLQIIEYFKDNSSSKAYTFKPVLQQRESPDYLNVSIIDRFAKNYISNHFIQFLASIFTKEQVRSIITTYRIGTSTHWSGATVFWQIDNKNRLRSGKILLYNATTGNRVKEPYPHITWYHKTANLKNFNLSQCLFGLHLLNENHNSPISIVESEKTACIMSELAHDTIWLATGSLHNINDKIFEPIFDRDIILFPDASLSEQAKNNCYNLWKQKAIQLKKLGYNISVSNLLEKRASQRQKENGYDIADFFIEQLKKRVLCSEAISKENTEITKLYSPKMKKLKLLQEKNPYLEKMIEVLDLEVI